MDGNGHNQAENERLDRVERIMVALAGRQELIEDEFSRLLKAQVVLQDSQRARKRRSPPSSNTPGCETPKRRTSLTASST